MLKVTIYSRGETKETKKLSTMYLSLENLSSYIKNLNKSTNGRN